MSTESEDEYAALLNPSVAGRLLQTPHGPHGFWWSEGTIAYVHGMKQARCERCVVEEQLKFARERAAAIPGLEKRLTELGA